MYTVVTLLKTRGQGGVQISRPPFLAILDPVPFFPGLFPLADFRTQNVKYCCVIISPLFIPFTPFYELQIMQASLVLSLKVDLIGAPNCEIYQFYQSLIKIKDASRRFIFCLSGLLGFTSNAF